MIDILYGEEPYLIDRATNRKLSGKEVVSFSEISNEILYEMNAPSFFGEKVCVLKIPNLKGMDACFLDQAQVSEGLLVVLVENIDKRLSLFKYAEKLGVTTEFKKLSDGELLKFICSSISQKNKLISKDVVNAFIERINYMDESCNLYQVEFSVAKLLAVADSEDISLTHVELAIEDNSSGNVFNIVKHLNGGDLRDLEKEIRLIPEQEALKVLGLVLSKFRIAYKTSMLFDSNADAAKAIGCSEWAIVKFPVETEVLSKCIDLLVSAMQDIKYGADSMLTVRFTLLQVYYCINI